MSSNPYQSPSEEQGGVLSGLSSPSFRMFVALGAASVLSLAVVLFPKWLATNRFLDVRGLQPAIVILLIRIVKFIVAYWYLIVLAIFAVSIIWALRSPKQRKLADE